MFEAKQIQSLNDLEHDIYDYVLTNLDKVIYMKIRDLAEVVHVSTSTIVRFCRKMGFEGYAEFKLYLKMHRLEKPTLLHDGISYTIESLKKLASSDIDEKIDLIVNRIKDKKTIIFLGVGNSGFLAHYAARYFCITGKYSVAISDPYYPVSMIMDNLEECSLIILSVSGESQEIIERISIFKDWKSTIISITASANSTIAKMSDINIAHYSSEERVRGSDSTSQISVLYLLETISRRLHNIMVQDTIDK